MKKILIGLLALSSVATMASVQDVGVIGPSGEVILYYKDGNHIAVKNCAPNTILGLTQAEARKSCESTVNKVPFDGFKQAIKRLVNIKNVDALKPLTAEEVLAYEKKELRPDQVEAMKKELSNINAFISAYGAENANMVRKKELDVYLSASQKVDAEIEKIINLISNQKVTLTKFSLSKDQFLQTVLKQLNPVENFICGLEGSVEDRLKDCAFSKSSQKDGFVLVTRIKKDYIRKYEGYKFKHEIYLENSTGLLWGSDITGNMTQEMAIKKCKTAFKDYGFSGVTWRLPTKEEFFGAIKNGIKPLIPGFIFWTSSIHSEDPNLGWGIRRHFDEGTDDYFTINYPLEAQCVGEY